MNFITPEDNESFGNVWTSASEDFGQALEKYGLSYLKKISVKSIEKELIYRAEEDQEIDRVLGEISQRFFHRAVDFLVKNLPEGSVLRETMVMFEEALTIYYDEQRKPIRGPVMPSIVAPNVKQGIKDIINIWGLNVETSDEDGNLLDVGDTYNFNVLVDDDFGTQINLIMRDDGEEEENEENEDKSNAFYYQESETVDLVYGRSSQDASYKDDLGDPDRTVKMINDIGFLYIPYKFIDRVGRNPLEALADVLEVGFKIRDAVLGIYDTEVTQRRAESYRAQFLMLVLERTQDGDLIFPPDFSERSIRILEDYSDSGENGYHYTLETRSKIIPELN